MTNCDRIIYCRTEMDKTKDTRTKCYQNGKKVLPMKFRCTSLNKKLKTPKNNYLFSVGSVCESTVLGLQVEFNGLGQGQVDMGRVLGLRCGLFLCLC